VQQREKELERGGKYPKIDSEEYRTSQFNSCDEINTQPCKDKRIIHQVIHNRNQTWFVRVFREITNNKHSEETG